MQFIFVLASLLFLAAGCSESTNFNQLFVAEGQKESVDYLLKKAELAYDDGKYEDARSYAAKALALNSENEEAAVILSYAHLGLAGIDTFQLAKNMIKQSEGKTTLAATGSAVESLSGMSDIIGLDDTDKAALTVDDNQIVKDDGTIIKGASDNDLFAGMDISIPKDAVEARDSASAKLQNMVAAISVICPFVAQAVKILEDDEHIQDDERHGLTNCTPTTREKFFLAKSHFVWALAHLTEAIAFNSLISEATTTLNLRGAALEKGSGGGVSASDYIAGISEMATIINVIMPTDDQETADSMITAIFNDLEAAAAAFANLPGIPESITKSITDGLDKLVESSKSIQTGGAKGTNKAAALKDQMVGQISSKMRTEITAREGDFTGEQKTDACEAYRSITTEAFSVCD